MAPYSCEALPIPPILDLGEAPSGFFAISERAHGDFLDELDEAGMRAILPGLLTALLTVRRIDLSSSPATAAGCLTVRRLTAHGTRRCWTSLRTGLGGVSMAGGRLSRPHRLAPVPSTPPLRRCRRSLPSGRSRVSSSMVTCSIATCWFSAQQSWRSSAGGTRCMATARTTRRGCCIGGPGIRHGGVST
jgi:hypothetical protein